MTPLDRPHHDGSPLYVSTETPELGGTVTVRMRASHADPIEAVWIRTTFDAEPTYHRCEPSADDAASWWVGEVPAHNPVLHYRFLIARADGSQSWLTAAGEQHYDGPDVFDFRLSSYPAAPDWARDGVVYQIFPDRFAKSREREAPAWAVPAAWDDEVVFEPDDPHTPLQFFGGDLDGIVEHLDHVARAGADVIYTTPVLPGESNHRYNASTFAHVDPLLGGDEAYERLSRAVHARGWRLLGDLTTNHSGDTHEWFRTAQQGGSTRSWYYFDGERYETWMGYPTLPKLNHLDPDLRKAMVEGPDSVVARWLRPPYDVDGWRIDVANMTGRLGTIDVNHEVARAVRATAEAEKADPYVVGEHNHDASGDIDGDGWHGTMNYSGFSWPVWSWLRSPDTPARPFGRPLQVPRRDGFAVARSLDEWRARYGWRAVSQSWNILTSHDSARIRTIVGTPEAHRVAAGLQFTLPGIPMLFAGDEIGLEGVTGEDSRRPMPWDHEDRWDHETLRVYGDLAQLRREHPALRRGGFRWAHVDADTLAFLREHPDETLLVIAQRTPGARSAALVELVEKGDVLLQTEGLTVARV